MKLALRIGLPTLMFLSQICLAADKPKRTFKLTALSPAFWKLVDHDAKLTKVAGDFGFTEGPVWDDSGFLYVSDEEKNKIYRVFLDGRKEEVISLGDPDGNTYDRQHRLIDCASVLRAIIAVTPDGKYTVLADHYEGKKLNSPNDVILGPDGAIYFTDPTLDLVKGEKQELSFQGVYRLDQNGSLRLLTKDLTQPNGLAFSQDGKRFYVDDDDKRNIRVYDVAADGSFTNGKVFGEEPGGEHEGVPDGIKVDESGNLYVTGPKGIWIWDPQGHHLGTIEMPEQPANLTWGDKDLKTLYITATTSVYRLKVRAKGYIAADQPSTIHIDASHPVKNFDPDVALGTSIDILPQGAVDKVYTPGILKESLSAGWGPITYRQNTELQGAAWHWNPNGTWSNPATQNGYFVGSAELGEPIRHSAGYPLPHRGNTSGDGRTLGKYSRMTDGDPNTYWKSNPYLTSKFTGEDDSLHPQWVVLDLGTAEKFDTLRIDWAEPYARQYEVQYWTSEREPLNNPTAGVWISLASVTDGHGGNETLHFAQPSSPVRHIRLWMTQSSNSAAENTDPRNAAGYAIRELYAGTLTNHGDFVDLVTHRPDGNQTVTFASSVDPWHTASDLDPLAGDQTGMDLFYTSGITNNLPAMIPIAMLYSTPEDAAAQIAYVKKRGYPISYIEMGEEPDGQKMLPEDYGALYLQFAAALHRVDPQLKLGGPVFEGVTEDIRVWPDSKGQVSWLGRFINYLKAHQRLDDLAFVSFEHYPYPPCEITWSDLYREPELTEGILKIWRADGVPANVPLINTESNLSWGLTQPMTDIFAALWLGDSVGSFLTLGGDIYYHSPIQPEPLHSGCRGWSTYGNFVADANLNIREHAAQYYASQMINLEWVKHHGGNHQLFVASSDLKDGAGHSLITAYPVQLPDGEWSVLIVNKDQSNSHKVKIAFDDGKSFAGQVSMVNFGSEQYVWRSEMANSHAEPNIPPVHSTVMGDVVDLPKASLTVLRGKIGAGTTSRN